MDSWLKRTDLLAPKEKGVVSILVLMDSWLKLYNASFRSRIRQSVSILVLMDSWLKQDSVFLFCVVSGVSILVLMDSWLKHGSCFRCLIFLRVSILVLMDSWLKLAWGPMESWSSLLVSILVLMDSWLKQEISEEELALRACFNPCFNG